MRIIKYWLTPWEVQELNWEFEIKGYNKGGLTTINPIKNPNCKHIWIYHIAKWKLTWIIPSHGFSWDQETQIYQHAKAPNTQQMHLNITIKREIFNKTVKK